MLKEYLPTHHTPNSRDSRLHLNEHLLIAVNHHSHGHTRSSSLYAVVCDLAVTSGPCRESIVQGGGTHGLPNGLNFTALQREEQIGRSDSTTKI